MDNQTNYPVNEDDNSDHDRPLTSFLQAQQTVRAEEKDEDDVFSQNSWQNQAAAEPDEIDYTDNAADNFDNNDESPAEEIRIPQFGDILSDDTPVHGREDENYGSQSEYTSEYQSESEPVAETYNDSFTTSSNFDANKFGVALKALRQMEQQISTVIELLEGGSTASAQEELQSFGTTSSLGAGMMSATHEDIGALKPIDGRVVEGVFDGRGMVGSDGKSYLVPPNYASKSKLVEGDMLKLTITPKGSFIYKQIGPIERSRLIGSLGFDQTIGEYYATSENRRWNVLKASVTYFKGEPGDEVVLLVPKNAPSKWAAVENIIKRNPLG